MIRRLLTALAFLTRIPVNPKVAFDGSDVARSTVFFPLIGCLIAAIQIGLMWLLNLASVPYLLQALAVTAVMVLVGGGLHQDGLADMADGFGGGYTTDDVLRIMRDSTIGTYGGIALFLSLGTRVVALAALAAVADGWHWIVVAAALSRCSICLGWLMPYARDTGAGAAITQLAGPIEVGAATLMAVLISVVLVGTEVFLAVGLCSLVFILVAWRCHRRIRGVTGDTLGAATEIAEVLLLSLGATIVSAT